METRHSWQRVRSALAEFTIIVAGVLVALTVDQWQDSREDRALEVEYILRLRADLAADTAEFSEFATILETKAEVLLDLVGDSGRDLSGLDAAEQMTRLFYSSFVALPPSRSSTFQELRSTGNLGLIRDISLRGELTRYYSGFEHISGILVQSFGTYRERLYSSLPGSMVYEWRTFAEPVQASDLQRGLEALIGSPGLEPVVNSELAYTAAMLFYVREYNEEAQELLRMLEQ